MSFALIHAARKTLSTVKGSLISVWTHNTTSQPALFPTPAAAEQFLAMLDFGFLFAYAIGLYIGGILGDRYSPRIVLSIGVWLSAIVIFLFGYVTEVYRFYHSSVYFSLWLMGGLFQSVAWPTEICIMGNWFGRGSRGLIMGVWSGCASAGNIIGTLITSGVIYAGYEYAFAVNSTILFLFGFVIFFCLKAHPREIGLSEPWEWESEQNDVIEESTASRPIGFLRAWKLPGVIPYSFAYACLKMVTYGFFFWLPFYLYSHFGWAESDAGTLSTFFDVGGIIAAVVGGAISDRLSSRTPVVVVMLIIASFCLGVYSFIPGDFFINALMLTVVGFFVAGPANMISSSVSADLGKARELRGNTAALSTVTGIVDGTGSVGAAIGMIAIPEIQRTFGWSYVFYGFIVMVICTTGCLLPTLYREWRDYRRTTLGMDPEEIEEEEGERQGLLAAPH